MIAVLRRLCGALVLLTRIQATAMMHRIDSLRRSRLVLPAFLLALAACQNTSSGVAASSTMQTPTPQAAPAGEKQGEKQRAQITNEYNATADVVSINAADREVTLRREDGKLIDVTVGEGARNFDQIKVGDQVRVRYKEALTATKLPPGEAKRPVEGALTTGRSKAGAKPAGGVGAVVTARVQIESIDKEHGIVVYSLASGELVAHRLQTQEGRDFVAKIAVGDIVQIDCAQAIALTVETP